jgi:23S rRNA (cytidine1920-2'-O)/16S rRNA (cytidine1409-2'-O)-methyltransferase
VELVRRGLVDSRGAAQRAIAEDRVVVQGIAVPKPATLVGPADRVTVAAAGEDWAGRGALKLVGALDAFGIDPAGRRCLDVGASTGGFTDVLLRRGAAAVTAVDVGYGQLVWRLQNDDRVTVVDRTNFRTVDVRSLDPPFDLVVVDVSFISVTLLADNLAAAGRPGTDYVVLVKPQFEAGRRAVGKGGIVADPGERAGALLRVSAALDASGAGAVAAVPSPIAGTRGNRELFLHARLGAAGALDPTVAAGVAAGEAVDR